MESLQGKIAIVTGGGSGIGRGVALALAREGARIVVCGRRGVKLDETVNVIQEISGVEKVKGALAVQADVSREEDVSRLVNATLEAFGRVDILVNNAGISEEVEFHRLDAATWDRVMNVNLRGPFLTMRRGYPDYARKPFRAYYQHQLRIGFELLQRRLGLRYIQARFE